MSRKISVTLAVTAAVVLGVLPIQGALAGSGSGAVWQIVPSPDPGTLPTLDAVGASSASDAWAVGSYTNSDHTAAFSLAEHWDGSAWTVTSTPNPFGTTNGLGAVADLSPTNAWAVGYSSEITNWIYGIPVYVYQPLIEHWDGTSWSAVSAPNDSNREYLLYGVAAVSANDIWAVGSLAGSQGAITEHWDGSSWSIMPAPASTLALTSVTAISSSDVWATGEGPHGQPAFDHWDGTAWTAFSGPQVNNLDIYMTGITAASASDVWAVGTRHDNGTPDQTLAEHWNGTGWSIVRSPDPAKNGSNGFTQVAAVSGNDVWAVGYSYGSTGPETPLMANWDGKKWEVVTAPVPAGTQINELAAVTALPTGTAWAAGRSDNQSMIMTTSNG
jgi:hypothetical protein